MAYSWIPWTEIVAKIFTKQGSRSEALDEILVRNDFRHVQTEDNLGTYEEDKFKIRNLITKKDKEAEKMEWDGRVSHYVRVLSL